MVAVAVFVSGCIAPSQDTVRETVAPTMVRPSNTIVLNNTMAAEIGSISGIVADPEMTPIVNASIELLELSSVAWTGPGGTFEFQNVPIGSHVLHSSAPGFIPKAVKVDVKLGEPTDVRIVLAPLILLDVAYHLSIPRDFYMDLANSPFDAGVNELQRQGVGVNRSMYCSACQSIIHFDRNPTQWIGEGTWQGGSAVLNERLTMQWATLTKGIDCKDCVKTYQFQGIITKDGKWEVLPTTMRWVSDGDGTWAYHNVTSPQLSFQHRATTWTTLAYVDRLVDDFTALPRP